MAGDHGDGDPTGWLGRLPGLRRHLDPEELRRRNPRAVAMDVLVLFTTAFFAHLFVRGPWPAVLAAMPLGFLLYFGWRSSVAFAVAQAVVVAVTAGATVAGFSPL